MKTFFCICLFCSQFTSFAQHIRENASPIIVEWTREFAIKKTESSGLVVHAQSVYFTQTGGSSVFNVLGNDGILTYSTQVLNTRIRSLFLYGDFLYSMGDQHLTKRDVHGTLMDEVMLPWKEEAYISTHNGAILNGRAYAYSFCDLMKYTLNGDQVFRNSVAKLCSNQKLRIGGNYIFLHSLISDPPLGSRVMKYDTLGNQKWSISPGGYVSNILADSHGNCFTFIVIPEKSNVVNKYDPEGNILWSQTIPGQAIVNGSLYGDTLFVCGMESIEAANGQLQNPAYSAMLASNGEILWQQTLNFYDGDEGTNEHFSHVVYDGNALYLGGTTGGQTKKCFLVKLSEQGNTTVLPHEKAPRTGFNTFPNPGGTKFTITCENGNNSPLDVIVRNISGQVVYRKQLVCNADRSFSLDLGKQAPGNYSVEVISGNEQVVKKIVVE